LKIYPPISILIALAFFACSRPSEEIKDRSVFSDSTIVNIYRSAQRRDTASLLRYLEYETPAYRMAAAKLIGSMPSGGSPTELLEALTDPIPYVRIHAAFAVGQFRDEKALAPLEKAFKKSTIPEIKAELLEAIGKCANPNAMDFLVRHNPNTAIEEIGKMEGIFQGAIKGLLKLDHTRTVLAHLSANESETRLLAAQILARQNTVDLKPFSGEIKEAFSKETIADNRAAILKALIKGGIEDHLLTGILKKEVDPLVASVAISGIQHPEEHQDILEEFLLSGQPWTAAASAMKLGSLDSVDLEELTITAARTTEIPEVAALAFRSLIVHNPAEASIFLTSTKRRFDNPVKEAVLLGAYAFVSEGLDSLRPYMFVDGPMGTAAWATYFHGCQTYPEWKTHFGVLAERALTENLPSQSILIAQSLRDPAFQQAIDPKVLSDAAESFKDPEDVEAFKELQSSLKTNYGIRIDREPYDYPDVDWSEIARLGKKVYMDIYTEKSRISLKLLPEDAPVSVYQIVKLAENGFYEGTHFHRVVPSFVTQGGGPRGDGFGSHSALLRSELSPLSYGKGVVGLASAGPDTESCQFFITHMSVPHLDGRYTIIGATEDPIDEIETGALIKSVLIRRTKNAVERNH